MAIFLDRDGVINRQLDGDYVKSWEEFEFLPGVLGALAELARFDERIIIATNQQGIGLGRMTAGDLDTIHDRMTREIASNGGRVDDIYVCPHRASDDCDCRKPKSGLLRQAAREHGFDLSRSWFVGDSGKDILAGHDAGCRTILVGKRRDEERVGVLERGASPTFEASDLAEAVRLLRRILNEEANLK